MSKDKKEKKEENIEVVDTIPVQQYDEAAQLYGGRNPIVDSHLHTIEQYIDAMSPGVMVDPAVGAMWQNKLFNAILGILRLENIQDMVDGMDGVMDYFRNYANGAMHLSYTQRFLDVWVVEEYQRDLYGHLCVLLSTYSDPGRRARHASHIALSGDHNILKHLDSEAQARLVQYLNRYVQ